MAKYALLLAAAWSATGVSAQSEVKSQGVDAVGDIIVTAQKRAQNLQDAPISIAVVQGSEIQNRAINDLEGMQAAVPNFVIQKTTAIPQIYIRGFGSSATNFGFDQSVSLYIDGVYHGRGREFRTPLYDLDRVEVLRGPQGALLGKNTAAGAVSIITANPTDVFEAGIDAAYNISQSGVDLTAFVSGPVTDTVSVRVAAKYNNPDGYIRNIALARHEPRDRNLSARASLKFAPGGDVDIVAKIQVDRLREYGSTLTSTSPTAPDPRYMIDVAPPFGVGVGDRQNDLEASLTGNIGIGDHTLTSITGYTRFDARRATPGGFVTPEPFLAVFDEKFDQLSQEVRILSPTGKFLEYIFGGYVDTSNYSLVNDSVYNIQNLVIGSLRNRSKLDSSTESVFAQALLNITPQFRLQGSARYTHIKKSANLDLVLLSGTPLNPPFAIPMRTRKENNFDPSVTVQYDIDSDIMFYATFAKGSKGGGFVSQGRQPSAFEFSAEKSTNYEAGIKSRVLDRRVLFNLSVYKTTIKNLQVSVYEPKLNAFVTGNAASATSKGFESNLEIVPDSRIRIFGTLAYTDAKYDDFPGAACPADAAPGCTSATNNLAGYPLVAVSKWSGTAGFRFTQPVASGVQVELAPDIEFRSGYVTATDYSPVYGRQPGYAKLNGRISLGDIGDRWTVAVVGKNLLAKKVYNFSYLYALPAPPVAVFSMMEPRVVLLQARYRF